MIRPDSDETTKFWLKGAVALPHRIHRHYLDNFVRHDSYKQSG